MCSIVIPARAESIGDRSFSRCFERDGQPLLRPDFAVADCRSLLGVFARRFASLSVAEFHVSVGQGGLVIAAIDKNTQHEQLPGISDIRRAVKFDRNG
jgi:hypothetical protein